MKYEILDRINSPEDLQILPKSDLAQLAGEIREFIIETVKRNGGHLASNLGAVEITLAVHRVFDSPKDHIVFDVGHQSYTHKIITGRRDSFEKLRKTGGLSGFPSIKESAHDAFGTGHSSTSISAAIGLATADKLQGRASHSVCIIGDGAFTGGMVHEALNNIAPELPLVIILNENGMAISKNRGLFADFISRQRVNTKQGNIKRASKASRDENAISKLITNLSAKIKNVFYSPSYFEKLGLEYVGPIDGHDIEKLEKALSFAKSLNKPVIVHVKTLKGKGYLEAEKKPSEYHSFQKSENESSFSDVLTSELISRAKEDKTICAITPAMAKGTGFYRFGEIFPERYFDTGIAEAHALTFAAALAKSGMKPFVATYSTFLQRGYDNLIHDIALQNLPVKIIVDRAGLAASDGATHHGIFDVAYLSEIPNMTIFAPVTYASLRELIHVATVADSPVAIRYSSSPESETARELFFNRAKAINVGISADFDIKNPPEYVFVTYGKILDSVLEAEAFLRAKGLSVGVILTEVIKPYDFITETLMSLSGKVKRILYVEEGIENGGAATLTMNSLRKSGFDFGVTDYRISAIEDSFVSPDAPCDIYEYAGLSPRKLVERMLL
jgi:1-deoxy-D-xylulose-5-phosphate synthase